MFRHCLLVVTLLLLVWPKSSWAEPSVTLTLNEALSRAEQASIRVRSAKGLVRETDARKQGLGTLIRANPRLSAELRPPVTGGTWHDVGYAANLELLLDVGGVPGARVGEMDAASRVAKKTVDVEKLDAKTAMFRAYLRASISEQRILEATKMMELANTVLDAAKQREAVGSSGEIDLSLAKGEVAETKLRVESALRERLTAQMEIRSLLDLPPGTQLVLTTPIAEPTPLADPASLIRLAVQRRPELAVMQQKLSALDRTEERLHRENFPKLGAYGGVDAAPVSPIFAQIGISGELPIFLRNSGALAAVDRARETEREKLQFELRQTEREIFSAHEAFRRRLLELQSVTQEGLPAAKRTLELIEIGWRAGRFDIFRLISAAREVARLESLRVDVFEAAWIERINVARSTGGILP